MIKKRLKKGKSVIPTWLMSAGICRTSIDYGEKIKTGSFQPTLWLLSAVEVDYLFTVIYWCYADVYSHESDRCHTLPFFLTYFFFYLTFPGFPFILILATLYFCLFVTLYLVFWFFSCHISLIIYYQVFFSIWLNFYKCQN